jgi:hypothetical protein
VDNILLIVLVGCTVITSAMVCLLHVRGEIHARFCLARYRRLFCKKLLSSTTALEEHNQGWDGNMCMTHYFAGKQAVNVGGLR